MHPGQERQPRLPEVSRTGRQPLFGLRRPGDRAQSGGTRISPIWLQGRLENHTLDEGH